MKRRSHARIDQPQLKRPNSQPSQSLQSKITAKLQSLFNGFVSELQSISTDKRPDVSDVFSTKHSVENPVLKCSENSEDDTSSLVLQNFINSAKSRISDLLNKKKEKVNSNESTTRAIQLSPQLRKSSVIDPLQVQISLKLQSLLCKALDDKQSNTSAKGLALTSENVITDNEWQDLSLLLQDFMTSAKRKLSVSLKTSSTKPFPNGSVSSLSQSPRNFRKKLNNSINKVSSNNQLYEKPELQSSLRVSTSMSKLLKRQSVGMESLHSSDDVVLVSQNLVSAQADDDCHLLDEEPEQISDYLELEVNSDVDDPDFSTIDLESDEEVVVLGVKSRTFEEIVLSEDDEDDEIFECGGKNNVPKPSEADNEVEELLFKCPLCEKSFRVESLLRFHIRMHGAEVPSPPMSLISTAPVQMVEQDNSSNRSPAKVLNSNHRFTRKEKENSKSPKSSKTQSPRKLRETLKTKK